jgi:hypothetical protein
MQPRVQQVTGTGVPVTGLRIRISLFVNDEMRHVVAVALEQNVIQTFFELIVRRRNHIVEPANDLGIVSIAPKGENFHSFFDSDDLLAQK